MFASASDFVDTMRRKARAAAKRLVKPDNDAFLKHVTGVIHVGANTGQERELYDRFGLRVLWVEPIPEVFAELQRNIADFPRQRAVQALITDVDDREYEFHVASNGGASSSILELAEHKDIWPEVSFQTAINLTSVTLDSFWGRAGIDKADYDALIMDTQGSELLVLQGGAQSLRQFKYIKTEAPDFEAYVGCTRVADLEAFMAANGFREKSRNRFATRTGGGSYFDIVYQRAD